MTRITLSHFFSKRGSKAQLARLLGVSHQLVSKFLAGERSLICYRERIEAIVRELGWDPADIIFPDEAANSANSREGRSSGGEEPPPIDNKGLKNPPPPQHTGKSFTDLELFLMKRGWNEHRISHHLPQHDYNHIRRVLQGRRCAEFTPDTIVMRDIANLLGVTEADIPWNDPSQRALAKRFLAYRAAGPPTQADRDQAAEMLRSIRQGQQP